MPDFAVIAAFKSNPIENFFRSHWTNLIGKIRSNWQEQYDAEKECCGDTSLLGYPVWYANHPDFARILMKKGIIERILPKTGYQKYKILSRNYEAVVYRIWQKFYDGKYSTEEFFSFFLSSKGKPFDKKTIRSLSKHLTELTDKIWTHDFETELIIAFNHK